MLIIPSLYLFLAVLSPTGDIVLNTNKQTKTYLSAIMDFMLAVSYNWNSYMCRKLRFSSVLSIIFGYLEHFYWGNTIASGYSI